MKKEQYKKRPLRPLIPMNRADPLKSDPLGSYTGVPEDPFDKPVQDADDL